MAGRLFQKPLSWKDMFNVTNILQTGGLLLVLLIIFAESGLMLGFFLPGDTLLLSAGVFAAQGKLPGGLLVLTIGVAIAAVAGDNIGYQIGRRYGRRLFRKPDGLIFRQSYVQRSEAFFERFGNKTMLLAHFVPVVRTFAPVVAGVAEMPYRQFVVFDLIGDTAWAIIVPLIGYFFGTRIPNIDKYILFVVAAAVLLSFGPMVYHLTKALLESRRRKAEKKSTDSDS